MASITSWNRLEPLPRTGDLDIALSARVADPAWLLARQWQLLEFAGEDGGSPIEVRVTASEAAIDRVALGPAAIAAATGRDRGDGGGPAREGTVDVRATPHDDRTVPLETTIEAEAVTAVADERMAVTAGLHLVRMLRGAGHADVVDGLLAVHGFEPGPEDVGAAGASFRSMARGRAPDARRVVAALREDRADDDRGIAGLDPAPAEAPSVRAVLADWLAWVDGLVVAGSSGWDATRLEYTGAVELATVDGPVTLTVEEITDGRVDWHAFDHGATAPVDRDRDGSPEREPGADEPDRGTSRTITRTVVPTPASWPGRPVDRFWQFEDGRVDLGPVDAGPADLLRMVLVEFALTSGHDWFVVPIDLRSGSLCTIESVEVTDTFGVVRTVPPIPSGGGWALFELAGAQPDRSQLWLPPVVAGTVEGDPIESVTFLRDEMANMAWAVEERVTEATGDVRDRTAPNPDAGRDWLAGDQDGPDVDLRYRTATPVPEHWIPLVPVPTGDHVGEVVLERRTLRRGGPDGPVEVTPLGRILQPELPLRIAEEEVGREGVVVDRCWQLARWTDGSTHVWLGRRRRVGRGEGHSGLRFDVIERP